MDSHSHDFACSFSLILVFGKVLIAGGRMFRMHPNMSDACLVTLKAMQSGICGYYIRNTITTNMISLKKWAWNM